MATKKLTDGLNLEQTMREIEFNERSERLRSKYQKQKKSLSRKDISKRLYISMAAGLLLAFSPYIPKGLSKKNNDCIKTIENYYCGTCSLEVPLLLYYPKHNFWTRPLERGGGEYILTKPIEKENLSNQQWINKGNWKAYCVKKPEGTVKGRNGELKVNYEEREYIQKVVKNYRAAKTR